MGLAPDGWMMPDAKVRVRRATRKQLVVTVEVPGWFPFRYPLQLEAVINGHPDQTLSLCDPGIYQLILPLEKRALIELRANQWFIPANVRIGSEDTRQLSYRIVDATVRKTDNWGRLRSLKSGLTRHLA